MVDFGSRGDDEHACVISAAGALEGEALDTGMSRRDPSADRPDDDGFSSMHQLSCHG
jgi:hypothetical protein